MLGPACSVLQGAVSSAEKKKEDAEPENDKEEAENDEEDAELCSEDLTHLGQSAIIGSRVCNAI